MDPLITGLLNFGGVGVLAAVLFWLHTNQNKQARDERDVLLKVFREETKYEREQCQRQFDAMGGAIERNQEVIMDAIASALRLPKVP